MNALKPASQPARLVSFFSFSVIKNQFPSDSSGKGVAISKQSQAETEKFVVVVRNDYFRELACVFVVGQVEITHSSQPARLGSVLWKLQININAKLISSEKGKEVLDKLEDETKPFYFSFLLLFYSYWRSHFWDKHRESSSGDDLRPNKDERNSIFSANKLQLKKRSD